MRVRGCLSIAVAAAVVALGIPAWPGIAAAGGVPEDAGDGAVAHTAQHGPTTGHLPASSENVELVGKVELTSLAGGIADVAALGNYAYLNAWSPEFREE